VKEFELEVMSMIRNTTQYAWQPRGSDFTNTRVCWDASKLRLGRRAARDGLPESARLAAVMESAIDDG
jgi:hypothetical protein